MSAARLKAIGTAYAAGSAVEHANRPDAGTKSSSGSSGSSSGSSGSSSSLPTSSAAASASFNRQEYAPPAPARDASELLWVDKYKPKRLEDVRDVT